MKLSIKSAMSFLSPKRVKPRGFTIVELLVAISIILILMGIILIGVRGTRERANAAKSVSNLREIHNAISMYVMNNDGEYPRSRTFVPEGVSGNPWNYEGGFWFNAIGEYLDEGRRFRQDLVGSGPWPQNIPFASPSITDKSLHGWGGAGIDIGLNGYLFPAGSPPTPRVRGVNIENPSRALLAVDAADPNTGIGSWQSGHPGAFTGNNIAFRHGGRANILFVDGSVGQIERDDLTPELIRQLAGK
jgi:prepilin-type processing-associated H-X9-DG protein/prepilin-type N-terminal cleavage/methylation domain-containing protein